MKMFNAQLFFLINSMHLILSICSFDKMKMNVHTTADVSLLSCTNCKWFIPNKNNENAEYGFCKMFTNFHQVKDKTLIINEYAVHCRKNEFQCGTEGYFFEPKDVLMYSFSNNRKSAFIHDAFEKAQHLREIRILKEKIKELTNLNCGEVNETQDLEDCDNEMKDIQQKIDKLME